MKALLVILAFGVALFAGWETDNPMIGMAIGFFLLIAVNFLFGGAGDGLSRSPDIGYGMGWDFISDSGDSCAGGDGGGGD